MIKQDLEVIISSMRVIRQLWDKFGASSEHDAMMWHHAASGKLRHAKYEDNQWLPHNYYWRDPGHTDLACKAEAETDPHRVEDQRQDQGHHWENRYANCPLCTWEQKYMV